MITKDKLVRDMYKNAKGKLTMKQIDEIVSGTFNLISKEIKKGKTVYIDGLGTFAKNKSIKKPFVSVDKVANKD